ncbi:MAG: hypothetical protein AB7N76_16310 [Planctomycetota bacterium]
MSSRPREALEFFRAIADGKVQLNAHDPSHAHALRAACGAVERFASLVELVPELAAAELAAAGGDDPDALERQRGTLERLRQAIQERLSAVEAKLEELARKQALENAPAWRLGAAGDPEFPGVVAIDLGSSNVVCAHWNYQAADPVVSAYEPLAVNVLDAAGFAQLAEPSFLTGDEALRHKSQINLYRSFRRLLGTQTQSRPAVTGGTITQVGVGDLAAAVLQRLLQRLGREVSAGPVHFPHVVVTVPATGDQAFEYQLRQVCARLGLVARTDLDEATAAGVYYLLRPLLLRDYARERRSDGEPATPADYYARHYGLHEGAPLYVLCIDLGGGTTDLALLRLQLEQDHRSARVHIEVTGTSGTGDLSGEGLTLFLFELLKRRLALALAHPRRALGGARPDPEPPHLHPWMEYHRLEVGLTDVTLAGRLDKGYRLLLERWDEVMGTGALDPALREAVDAFCPTISEGAPRQGAKFRKANFRWLWEEAERLKREVCAARSARERAAGGLASAGPARARLDLSTAPTFPHKLDLHEWLEKKGRVDPREPALPDALAISSDDIDTFVRRRGAEPLARALRSLVGGERLGRVVLAGNGAHAARPVVEEVLAAELGLAAEHVVFSPEEAKRAVAKGACLWAIGNRLEGIEVSLTRALRHPTGLALVSALKSESLFRQGEAIDLFGYAQPETREGDAADKLIQVDREVGGQLEPFLMFDPRQGTPLQPIASYPVARTPGLTIPAVDAFLEAHLDAGRCRFTVRDPHQYVQNDAAEWVSQAEVFASLRARMSSEEVIAWLEGGAAPLQHGPPPGKAFHRYYMDETRQLFLVFCAGGEKLLVKGTVVEQARREVPPDQDPWSGVH